MKWVFYVIVFIYMFYRAVYGWKNKHLASISVEEIKYDNNLNYYPAGVRKTVSCKASNKNQKVEWIDPKGSVVKRVSTNRVFVQEHFVPTSTLRTRVPAVVLVLTHAIVEDSGVWECRSGDLKKDVSICVIDPSKFVDTPTEVSVDKGRSITLSCQARGEPEPRLLWSRDGELITESLLDSKYRVMTKYNSQGFEGLLTINSLDANDSGVYTCEAIQESPYDASCTNSESFNITLQVNYAPVFSSSNDTEIVYQKDDESVDLICFANGFPAPAYTWFRDLGETLFEFPEERVNLQDGNKAVLTLPSNLSQSTQRYRCRASNQYGEANKAFAVVKLEPPTQPHKLLLQDAGHDSVRLYIMWNEEILFPIKVLDVQYIEKKSLPRRKIETLRDGDWEKSQFAVIDLEATEEVEADSEGLYITLSDLDPDSEYWIRVRAANDAGESPWSEPAYVQTVEEAENEAPEEDEERITEEDNDEKVDEAELAYSEVTFYGLFFVGAIVILSIACMFFMKWV